MTKINWQLTWWKSVNPQRPAGGSGGRGGAGAETTLSRLQAAPQTAAQLKFQKFLQCRLQLWRRSPSPLLPAGSWELLCLAAPGWAGLDRAGKLLRQENSSDRQVPPAPVAAEQRRQADVHSS